MAVLKKMTLKHLKDLIKNVFEMVLKKIKILPVNILVEYRCGRLPLVIGLAATLSYAINI